MWPDDNFGYIRHFPDAAERRRPGGSGVYYHLSYLGAPLSYLWLSTTPPALIREEVRRARGGDADVAGRQFRLYPPLPRCRGASPSWWLRRILPPVLSGCAPLLSLAVHHAAGPD